MSLQDRQPKTYRRSAFPAPIGELMLEEGDAFGHMVRSRAEMLVDNWLYQAEIVHAYERKFPLADEDAYCDFYVPAGRVYIEFWGMEENAQYAERTRVTQGIYKRAGFSLIELNESDIKNLDDNLARHLLKFKVAVP